MGQMWIEGLDEMRRPGGIGRAERERIFWERVASGRRVAETRDRSAASGAWESVEMAIVTLLTVVIFGLGWVSVELEGAQTGVGYDLASLESITERSGGGPLSEARLMSGSAPKRGASIAHSRC